MIPVLSRAQVRAFDKLAIEECSVPSLVLMENAARGATDVLVRELLGGSARGKRVVVLCGTGNNGGDGFAMVAAGYRPAVGRLAGAPAARARLRNHAGRRKAWLRHHLAMPLRCRGYDQRRRAPHAISVAP